MCTPKTLDFTSFFILIIRLQKNDIYPWVIFIAYPDMDDGKVRTYSDEKVDRCPHHPHLNQSETMHYSSTAKYKQTLLKCLLHPTNKNLKKKN